MRVAGGHQPFVDPEIARHDLTPIAFPLDESEASRAQPVHSRCIVLEREQFAGQVRGIVAAENDAGLVVVHQFGQPADVAGHAHLAERHRFERLQRRDPFVDHRPNARVDDHVHHG